MKHLIVGAGVVGKATGMWLIANKEKVYFYDINDIIKEDLKKEGYNTLENLDLCEWDLIWVCTHEKHTENVLKEISNSYFVIVRSTVRPEFITNMTKKYGFLNIAHIPEFLRASSAVKDVFNPHRIVIGTYSNRITRILKTIYRYNNVYFCTPEESSLIKLISNNWLAFQVSFWNEVKMLCDSYEHVNPQFVADMVTLDRRISKYGSDMIGKSFSGQCFPKDSNTLSNLFDEHGIKESFIHAMIKTNEVVKNEKRHNKSKI